MKSDFAFIANASRAKQAFGFLRRRGAGFAFAVDGAESVVASRAGFGVAAGGTVRQNRRTGGAYAVVDEFVRSAGKSFAFRIRRSAADADKTVGTVRRNIANDAFPVAVGF